MPAIKRRKVGQCKYKRVISQEPPKEKRKQEEGEEVTLSVEEGSPVPKRRVCGGEGTRSFFSLKNQISLISLRTLPKPDLSSAPREEQRRRKKLHKLHGRRN